MRHAERLTMIDPSGAVRSVARHIDRRLAKGWNLTNTAPESADNGAEFADRETAYNPGRLVFTKGQEARARELGPRFLAFLERLGLSQVTKSELDQAIDLFDQERAA